MGAQTTERKQKFIQRYKEVEKSEGEHFRRLTDSRGFKACLQMVFPLALVFPEL